MSNEKQSRLEKTRERLQTEWDLRHAKVAKLRKDLAIQAGSTNQFQLEQQLQEEEAELSKLENQLDQLGCL